MILLFCAPTVERFYAMHLRHTGRTEVMRDTIVTAAARR